MTPGGYLYHWFSSSPEDSHTSDPLPEGSAVPPVTPVCQLFQLASAGAGEGRTFYLVLGGQDWGCSEAAEAVALSARLEWVPKNSAIKISDILIKFFKNKY